MLKSIVSDAQAAERAAELKEEPIVLLPTGALEVPAMTLRSTRDCFGDCSTRDEDMDRFLPAIQPATNPCLVATVGFSKPATSVELIHALLGTPLGTSFEQLSQKLFERGHLMTVPQGEWIYRRMKNGEAPSIRRGALSFVAGADPDWLVFVLCVQTEHPSYLYPLHERGRWTDVECLLIPNLQNSRPKL